MSAGDHAGAESARERFEEAWRHADVDLQISDAGIAMVTMAGD